MTFMTMPFPYATTDRSLEALVEPESVPASTEILQYEVGGTTFVVSMGEFELALQPFSEGFQTMLVSEEVLAREWDTPEEDVAWAYLSEGT